MIKNKYIILISVTAILVLLIMLGDSRLMNDEEEVQEVDEVGEENETVASDEWERKHYSRIDPIIKAAKTIKQNWNGVMAFFSGRVSNGTIEGINSVIQTIKRQGKGYPNTGNFITLIYLRCAKLEFGLPRVCGVAHYR